MKFKFFLFVCFMLGAYVTGFFTHKFEWFPFYQIKNVLKPLETESFHAGLGNNQTFYKKQMACSELPEKTLVLFSLGQSNIANSGDSVSSIHYPSVYNFNMNDGKCYESKEPLLGPTGIGGSFLNALAGRILQHKKHDAVLLVPIAVSATKIEEWTEGPLFLRVEKVLSYLKQQSLTVDLILWQQGESNQTMSIIDYKSHLTLLLDKLSGEMSDVKMFLAQSTRCNGRDSETVRLAVKDTIRNDSRAFLGANSDTLKGPIYRYDGCHFNRNGLDMLSLLWFEALYSHL